MNWPHGPRHWLFEPGLYIVTAGTYRKLLHLNSPPRLDFFQESLVQGASEFGWRAWAVLANHYHFVAASPSDPRTPRKFLGKLSHGDSRATQSLGQQAEAESLVQFWDSHIRALVSSGAELVHQNPVRDGIVPLAEN
ncbi:MAG TPA: hypothetical protein VGM65_09980 [Candidatus Udaeobacter sp.]|jgi:hypothetical protein